VLIHAARQPVFDAAALVEHVVGFAALSNGIVKEIEMRRDGRWGQRLMKDRAAVAEMMESFIKRAPREILAVLPMLKTGSYAGGPRAPDLSHALDPEKAERARRYARLLVGCRPAAAAASFGAALNDARDEVIVALRPYCEAIVKELRESQGARRRIAEQYFEIAAELTTQFLSAEEGEFLRRRGRAALGTPAAA
jgi:sugar-specific transcriptional regulator TrmB